jgi:hypothetical protein
MKNTAANCFCLVLLILSALSLLSAQEKSQIAFKINEPDLIPEGTAYDSETKSFYIGSTYKRKIVRIDKNGAVTDFTTEAQDGARSFLGLKVDARRRVLWAVSEHAGGAVPFKGMSRDCLGCAEIFKYDLQTGKLIKKYSLDNKPKQHFLNDLAINSRGDVFITDTVTGEIYFISRRADRLELFYGFGPNTYPNGLDFSSNGKRLFVALQAGIAVIDLDNKKSVNLKTAAGVKIGGIDGLYFYRNSLLAVQPFEAGKTIVRYYLNKNHDAVTKAETVEASHKLFSQPTTGAIAGGQFYYIANSQLQLFRSIFQPDGSFDKTKLSDVLILKLPL